MNTYQALDGTYITEYRHRGRLLISEGPTWSDSKTGIGGLIARRELQLRQDEREFRQAEHKYDCLRFQGDGPNDY